MAAALLCGCNNNKEDEDNTVPCPVTGVEIPVSSADKPFMAGVKVTLQGQGFTDNSEIWLRGSAETRAGGQDVKAEVTQVTSSSITFVTPEVYGQQNVVLKQNGDEWVLGMLVFADELTLLPNKVSRITVTNLYEKSNVVVYDFSYDERGRIAKTVETSNRTDVLTTTYTYSDNEITATATSNGTHFLSSQQYKYTLDNGRAVRYEVRTDLDDETINDEVTVTYDDNGRIAAIVADETFERGESWTTKANEELAFENGTLQRYISESTDVESDGSENTAHSLELNFSPGPFNNLNIDIIGIDWVGEYMYATPLYLLNIGGERSLRLPASMSYKYTDNNTSGKDDEFTYAIRYVMSDEYITEINMSREGQLETTIEIEYQK